MNSNFQKINDQTVEDRVQKVDFPGRPFRQRGNNSVNPLCKEFLNNLEALELLKFCILKFGIHLGFGNCDFKLFILEANLSKTLLLCWKRDC